MTTDFMGELQDGIVGKGIFELEYLFYSVGDDKNVVNVPAVKVKEIGVIRFFMNIKAFVCHNILSKNIQSMSSNNIFESYVRTLE